MPALNAGPYITAAIKSIGSQTERSWELIVIDDASTDNTVAAAQAAAAAFADSTAILRLDKTVGPAAARNVGLKQARGEFVAFLDADDVWEPDHLANLLSFAREHSCGVVHSAYNRVANNGAFLGIESRPAIESGRTLEAVLYQEYSIKPSSALVARTLLQEVDGFDEQFLLAEDIDLWVRILAKVSKVCYSPKPTCNYRSHETSLSNRALSLAKSIAQLNYKHRNLELVPAEARVKKLRESRLVVARMYRFVDAATARQYYKILWDENPLDVAAAAGYLFTYVAFLLKPIRALLHVQSKHEQ